MALLARAGKPGPKARDLSGEVFGHLTVLHLHHLSRQGPVWLCRCRCGKDLEVTTGNLMTAPKRSGQKPKSCGCVGRNRKPYYPPVGDLSHAKFYNLMKGAERRNVAFDITIQYAWRLFLKQGRRCAYTGIPLTMDSSSSLKAGATTASLDRIDSSKGYIRGNVQWVHVTINFMKQALPDKDFVTWCVRVAEHAGKEFGLGTEKEPWLY